MIEQHEIVFQLQLQYAIRYKLVNEWRKGGGQDKVPIKKK